MFLGNILVGSLLDYLKVFHNCQTGMSIRFHDLRHTYASYLATHNQQMIEPQRLDNLPKCFCRLIVSNICISLCNFLQFKPFY